MRSRKYEYDEKGLFEEKKKKKSSIRHVETKIDFQGSPAEMEGDYGSAENMLDKWGLQKNEATLGRKSRRRLLRLMIAVAVVAAIALGIFYVLPKLLPGFFKGSNIELFVEKEVKLEYDDSYRVVDHYCADLMSDPDPKSSRKTQVLYNEPVKLINEEETNGYLYIMTEDGIDGYIKSSRLSRNLNSVEPDKHSYKLVVSDTYKNVMTHASNGSLITKVMMNTVLYADVKRDGVYQVALPNGDKGWIGSSGVIELGTREDIQKVSCRYFVSSVLSEANSTYINNGLTQKGMSINGLVYVCSEVNGIPMPRRMEDQANVGREVELDYDVVTGELLLESIEPGDLVFLTSPYSGSGRIYEMAVCTDTGVLLMVSDAKTTIRLRSFKASDDIASRIVSVRRVFD